jgi:hypothetical protein
MRMTEPMRQMARSRPATSCDSDGERSEPWSVQRDVGEVHPGARSGHAVHPGARSGHAVHPGSRA